MASHFAWINRSKESLTLDLKRGRTGRGAYHLLVQSEAGLVSITGTEEMPSKVGISIADIAAGMYAFSGVLAALLRRERTGEGAAVEVSMFDALAEWMGYPAYFTVETIDAWRRSGII
jgi:crotonobetainyl-CoA:carnitine CoA-transferase CaiB-like acyl-CoA transferase